MTALALAMDASYVGVGHASGHILLYDVLDAKVPVRHVLPVHPADVAQGKCEGHLTGAAVTHLAFVGRRKTAIVSADENGLCFYHSLGRVLGMASNDTLRVYGRYPSANAVDTVLDMAPLPLGTAGHQADEHKFVAILLREKLLLVGLAPSARTWYRSYARRNTSAHGALAWFPATRDEGGALHHPMLAFAFGFTLQLLHVKSVRVKPRRDERQVPPAIALSEETLPPTTQPIIRLQWIHRQLLMVVTTDAWLLYDLRLRAYSEWQPHDPLMAQIGAPTAATWRNALRVWHSKAFCLAHGDVYVGDLLPWDTRLAQLVHAKDFLGALQLGLELYQGHGLGSAIGLPSERGAQQAAIAARLEKLEQAAADALFANVPGAYDPETAHAALARTCATVAITTHRFDWLFHDLYNLYEVHGHESTFVHEMEQFILHGEMPTPVPSVMQRLLAFRAKKGEYERIEQLVLHVDPLHLDLDQTLPLCTKYKLWDAVVYVSTSALHDYTTPLHDLLQRAYTAVQGQEAPDAYRLFSFLASVSRGVQHPNEHPLPPNEARAAAADVYATIYAREAQTFLIPTAQPYPYLRMLLELDAEALLDVIDLGLEGDLYAEDEDDALPTRRDVVDALLAVSSDLAAGDEGFVALFTARNAAKYPQFLRLHSTEVQYLFDVLTRPAGVPAAADREFALECVFSAHAYPFTDDALARLVDAQFWRVYEYALRKTQRYNDLMRFFLVDQDGRHDAPSQLYSRVAELLSWAPPAHHAALLDVLLDAMPDVPDSLLGDVARVVARFFAEHTDAVFAALEAMPQRQYLYLQPFFRLDEETAQVKPSLRTAWLALVAEFCPAMLVAHLRARPVDFYALDDVLRIAREHCVYDAVLWAFDRRGETAAAMDTLDAQVAECSVSLLALATQGRDGDGSSAAEQVMAQAHDVVQSLRATVRMAVDLAVEHSHTEASREKAREQWYRVLRALIHYVHLLAEPPYAGPLLQSARSAGDALVQESLAALLTSVPSETVSFPPLFRRLVDAPEMASSVSYAEVRRVLDGMLEAYRLRSEVLTLGVRLNEGDTSRLFHELAKERALGWLIRARPRCHICHERLLPSAAPLTFSRSGLHVHRACGDSAPQK